MGKLSTDDIRKLARLARLDLSDEEVTEFSVELSEILQYVELLQAVDVTGLLPTNQVTGLKNVFREDIVKDYGYQALDLLDNVPTTSENQLRVKRMIG